MKLGILKEPKGHRVAMVPGTLKKLSDVFSDIAFESGAGKAAGFSDAQYEEHAKLEDRAAILASSDIVVSIYPLSEADQQKLQAGSLMIAQFAPFDNKEIGAQIKSRNLNAISLDMIPRTSLAQSMDILSSMASIAGYRAVLLAAAQLPRYFPMMITAAGSIRPAKVLVLGAGVAGLQAIATARRLGAMVEAFDVRSAVKEEVESLGARFIEVEGATEDSGAGGYAVEQKEDFQKRQKQMIADHASKSDVVITTAQLRGRPAPELIPETTVNRMRTGSIIVDLASSTGGNCPLSKDDDTIVHNGITIIGNSNLADGMPEDASTLYSNNISKLLQFMHQDGAVQIDTAHEIMQSALIAEADHFPPSKQND